jgi:magnesium transporter
MQASALMDAKSLALTPEMDREEAADLFRKYKLSSVPVVDSEQKPIGIVLVRDVLKVIEEETEEDFAKMAGTRQGLLSLSVFHITKIRFPWLIATCVGYFAVGAVVKHFEFTISKVIGLASFMPLIAAMGGNVGTQTATAVVRGMATGEVKALGKTEVVIKEALVGILLGCVYALGTGIVAHFIYGARFGWNFSLVVGLGMFASMSSAAIMGSLEPFIFERMHIDPATATGPLITFFADLTSTTVYLTIATWLFLKF